MTGSDNDTAMSLISELVELQRGAVADITDSNAEPEKLRMIYFGKNSEFTRLTKKITAVPKEDKARVGIVIKEVKSAIEEVLSRKEKLSSAPESINIDITAPGIRPPTGHLHPVTSAIAEITRIFERIGFTRVRYPEIDWDWYAFEALNMPANHPARDEWETFHILYPGKHEPDEGKFKHMVLTPHTSNGQVREMEKERLPIRMINIAKNYRRQIDVSHVPMLHQFEGLYVDRNVSIMNLKGVCDYFFREFFGPERKSRLRPFHFQFTEPSFEIDVTCGVCHGTGKLTGGKPCRLCKEGWLELGGAGMVHPKVLQNGGINPEIYSGFAFGWGVERTYMMRVENFDDIRLLYSNDIRILEQF